MSALRKRDLMTHSTSNLKYWSDSSPSVTMATELLRGTTQTSAGGGRALSTRDFLGIFHLPGNTGLQPADADA